MNFEQLGLAPELLRAVAQQGYTQPTPIQQKAIPLVLEGQDLMACAQTGTGKTAGFTLPILHRMHARQERRGIIHTLVLTPTRELAAQVGENLAAYGQHLPYRSLVVFGGVKIGPQIRRLQQGVEIVVATPGRLLDLAQQGAVDLSQVSTLILDEADRMLDMGFIHDIRRIIRLLPPREKRQNLLFSATFSREIRQLASGLMNDPVSVEVAPENTTAERIEQRVHPVDKHRKRELLSHMIGRGNWQQVLVFTRTKHGANRLSQQLEKDGLKSAAIHGNKSQAARTRALQGFKAGKIRVLVATDIAARGLDIEQLPHVVNYELPNVPEDYVHRIGRTGRAGREGLAISLVSADESKQLLDIERLLGAAIPSEVLDGYTPSASARSHDEPRPRQRKPATRRSRPQAGRKGRASAGRRG